MSSQDRKERSFLYKDAGGKGVYRKYIDVPKTPLDFEEIIDRVWKFPKPIDKPLIMNIVTAILAKSSDGKWAYDNHKGD